MPMSAENEKKSNENKPVKISFFRIILAGIVLSAIFWSLSSLLTSIGKFNANGKSGENTPVPVSAGVYGIIAFCSAFTVYYITRIVGNLTREPLLMGTVVLSLFSCFIILASSSLWTGEYFLWLFFSVITFLIVLFGRLFFTIGNKMGTFFGFLFLWLVPAAFLFSVNHTQKTGFLNLVDKNSLDLWIPVGLLSSVPVILAYLSKIHFKNK